MIHGNSLNLDHTLSKHEPLSKSILWSLGAHTLLFLFFFAKQVVFPTESIDFTTAVHVDIVDLPDKLDDKLSNEQVPPPMQQSVPEDSTKSTALPPSPPPSPSKEITPPLPTKPLPSLTKEKSIPSKNDVNLSKQVAALKKLKAMAALESIQNEVQSDQQKSALNKIQETVKKNKGNVITTGNAITGSAKAEHELYIGDLDRHIKKNWAIPQWLSKKNYQTQILVKIDSQGTLISKQIIKASGNRSYDDEALATIEKSTPFPAPPEKFVSVLKYSGFTVGFPE